MRDEGPPIIKRETESVQPIIVEATTAFAKANKVDIVRCDGDPDDPAKSKGKESVFQFFAPIGGINAVRMGHGAAVLREIRDTYCNGSQNFFHFYLLDTEEHVVPLNWTVSKTMASYIWDTAMKEEGKLLTGELYGAGLTDAGTKCGAAGIAIWTRLTALRHRSHQCESVWRGRCP